MSDAPLDHTTEAVRPSGGDTPSSEARQASRDLAQRESRQQAADLRNGTHNVARHTLHGRPHRVHAQTKKLHYWQRAVAPHAGRAWEKRASNLKPLVLTSLANPPTPTP